MNVFSSLMRPGRPLGLLVALVLVAATAGVVSSPPAARSQGADVLLNVLATGAKKLNIVIPNFAVVAGSDTAGLARSLPQVTAKDLTFSALFSVVSDVPPIPTADPAAVRATFANFAAAGAHAGLQGLLEPPRRPDRGGDAALRPHLARVPADRGQEVRAARPPRPDASPTRSRTRW